MDLLLNWERKAGWSTELGRGNTEVRIGGGLYLLNGIDDGLSANEGVISGRCRHVDGLCG